MEASRASAGPHYRGTHGPPFAGGQRGKPVPRGLRVSVLHSSSPGACGCCADFKLQHQESLVPSDFSFPTMHTCSHARTRTHAHTHTPASGLCQAPQVKCWLENLGATMSCEFCSSVKEKIPPPEMLSVLHKPEQMSGLSSGENQKPRRPH